MTTILERTAGLLAFVRTVDTGSFAGAARLHWRQSFSCIEKRRAPRKRVSVYGLLQRSTRTLKPDVGRRRLL